MAEIKKRGDRMAVGATWRNANEIGAAAGLSPPAATGGSAGRNVLVDDYWDRTQVLLR